MPDLTAVYYYHCSSAEDFQTEVDGSNGKKYTVRWNRHSHNSTVQFDYSCTCHAYKFGKGKYCKHIERVKETGEHCNWTQFTDGDEPHEANGQKFCPKCGNHVHVLLYGV